MGYLLISTFTLIVSYFLFKKCAGTMSLKQLNLISFNYYYQLILQAFIGVNIVIFGFDNHYLLSRIHDVNVKQAAYFSVMLVLILAPLSMLFISFIFKFNAKKEWDIYKRKRIKSIISNDDKAVFITLCLFTVFSLFSVVYTFVSVGTIPLLHLFSDANTGEAARIRINASRGFTGVVYIRNIFGLTLTPILSYIAYSYTIKTKYVGWKVIFRILVVLSILILSYNLAKAPVLLYILSFIFLKVLINGSINFKKMIKSIVTVISLIVLFYIFVADFKTSFLDINFGPLGRILLGQVTGLYFHFMYFPDIIPFLDGQGFPSFILKLFNIENVRSARVMMEIVNPNGIEQGTAGVMNTLFIAEIYANFGWLGIFFGTIYIGFYIQLMYVVFLRIPKNPITIALFTYFTYSLPINGGFFDFVYNPGMIITITLMFSFFLIAIMIHHTFVRTNRIKGNLKGEV